MQEGKNGRLAAFSISFGASDAEAADWLSRQPNKGAYLKSLILADRQQCTSDDAENVSHPRIDDSRWEANFALLKEFKEQFGRLPAYSECYKGFRLGRWMHDTARRARINRPDRLEKLQALGFADKWKRNLTLVERFRNTYGRLPCKNDSFEGVNIGAWLAVQTAKLRNEHDAFSKEQLCLLGALGIFATDWDRKFAVLEQFVAEHGRLPKYAESYRNLNLGRWLAHQRKVLDPVKHADRLERLESLCASVPPRGTQKLKIQA